MSTRTDVESVRPLPDLDVDIDLESLDPNKQRQWRALGPISFGHILMVVSGLVGFGLTLLLLNRGAETVPVAVADTDLPSGAVITGDSYRMADFPAESDFGSRFADADRLEDGDLRLAFPVEAGSPIPLAALTEADDETLLSRSEFSFPVEADKTPGGRLRVGDRVHVIAVVTTGSNTYSTFVATDVEVVGLPAESSGGFTSSQADDFVTVALSEAQLLAVAAAQGMGELEIARSAAGAPSVDISKLAVGTRAGIALVPKESLVFAEEAEAPPVVEIPVPPGTDIPTAPPLEVEQSEIDGEGSDEETGTGG